MGILFDVTPGIAWKWKLAAAECLCPWAGAGGRGGVLSPKLQLVASSRDSQQSWQGDAI